MSGITAVLCPTAPSSKGIHVLYKTAADTLGLQLCDKNNTHESADVYAAEGDKRQGIISKDSRLTTTNMTGVQIVAGFTNKKDADPSEYGQAHDVTIISPFFKVISETHKINTGIASCSSDHDAWILFITSSGSNDKPQDMTINEISPNGGETVDYSDVKQIMPGSSLAAYFVPDDEGKRYVIYQSSNHGGLLHEYCAAEGDKSIVNSDNAKSRTSLATACAAGKTYLYYVDHSCILRYIVKSKNRWGASQPVPGAGKAVSESSQISVVVCENANHIFYLPAKTTSYKLAHVKQVHE